MGKQATGKSETRTGLKILYSIFMITVLCIPVITPSYGYNWVLQADLPTSISNSGSTFRGHDPSFLEALAWLKDSTPEDSVVAAWWDYGYWIQTLGDRTTYADNATLDSQIIKKTAKMFYTSPDDAWKELVAIDADYVLIWVTAERVFSSNQVPLFLLGNGGGDEAKRFWFAQVADAPMEKYFFDDFMSGPNAFWHDTFLGKMIPFSPFVYVNPATEETTNYYQPNTVGVYVQDQDQKTAHV